MKPKKHYFIRIPEVLVKHIAKQLRTSSNPPPLQQIELAVQWATAGMLNGGCLAEARYGKTTPKAIKYLEWELNGHLKDLEAKK